MAGIVRKFFKSKKTKKEELFDDDDDYAELQPGPSPKPYRFTESEPPVPPPLPPTTTTPKLHHDETLDLDATFDQPNLKRRRFDRSSPENQYPSEDSIYEFTQFTLQKWEHEESRRQEKRKRKRVAERIERENYVHNAMESFNLNMPSVSDVEKLRRERDQFKKEMEKYRSKCEKLEKRCEQLEMEKKNSVPVFQPFNSNFYFGPATASTLQPFQLQPPALQFTHSFNFTALPSTSAPFPSAPPSAAAPIPAPSPFSQMGPVGPMAPRYTDPITVYDYNDDDDTSLSDLSNSSKSDISDDLK